MDGVALALCEVATISVRRSQHLVGGALGLPARLVTDPLRLGLLSEARLRATAASRESVPVDVMEDHVAMSGVAARQVFEVGELVRKVVAVGLVCAARALEYVGLGSVSSRARWLCRLMRAAVPTPADDRSIDLGPASRLV